MDSLPKTPHGLADQEAPGESMVAIPVEDEPELTEPLIVSEEVQPSLASEGLPADAPLPGQAAALPPTQLLEMPEVAADQN